jgi:phage major head subunit gpT-like protein
MAIVTSPVTLARGLRASFVKAYAAAEDANEIKPYIMETTSDGSDEEYGWLGQSPSMNEWVDERKLKALNDFDYKLKNKDYEATLSVDRNAIEDDRLGNVQIRINDLASKAKLHPRKLFFEALLAGTTQLCYDGQPFFSNAHVEGKSGVQSNLMASAGVTLTNLSDDINAAVAQMKGFKDDLGEPLDEGDVQIGIVCSLALQGKFEDLNTFDKINNTDNKYKGKIKSIVATGRYIGNTWYLANIKNGLKPFIRQVRKAVTFSSLEGESDTGFMRKVYHYGVDSREVFGYGLWQKMIKVG